MVNREVETCLACGATLVEPLWSISHTIRRGAKLCPDCGRRESVDRAWAHGVCIRKLKGAEDV
jgi:predicted RNA-binding Zn-ribbon protein involved in translation (DUF1610 family)